NGGRVGGLDRLDVEHEAWIDRVDADLLSAPQRRAFRHPCAPELAADEDLAVAAELADLTDHLLRADRDRCPPDLDRFRDREGPARSEHYRDRDDQPDVRVVGGRRV